MDSVVKGYVSSFVEQFGIDYNEHNESEIFEFFMSYLIISNEIQNPRMEMTDIESINTHKARGIDTIAFIINNKLVTSLNELKDLLADNSTANAQVVFIQSKTSDKFDDTDLQNFANTIKDFTKDKPAYTYNNEVKNMHSMLMHIYSKMANIREFKGLAIFCCNGINYKGTSVETTVTQKQQEIDGNNIFRDGFQLHLYGKKEINKLFQKISNPLRVEIKLDKITEIDNIPEQIDYAGIGLINLSEFKKIIIDEDTQKIRSLFYDNVRDALGLDNPVNKNIFNTLSNGKEALFPLLNNGITIIAEKNLGHSNKFILENFQIVNGCQTSSVIFDYISKNNLSNLHIPVKLIITQDSDIKDEIVIATNQQTEITKEQVLALSSFQKALESFYKQQSNSLFYERRAQQYTYGMEIPSKNIVTLREQIKTFVAIYREEPHLVSGYYGKIFKLYSNDMFLETHNYHAYYFAGFIQSVFKSIIQEKRIDKNYNKLRYFIFMLYRKIFESEPFKKDFLCKNSNNYFEKLINRLNQDKKKIITDFKQVIKIIEKSKIIINSNEDIYKKSTTTELLKIFDELYRNAKKNTKNKY